MWILESDGDFLRGKRLWLRPGQKYLFGRIRRDDVRFGLEHKSISRKHFLLEVGSVKPGDGAHIHARSRVTITDLKSKVGTKLDGKPLGHSSKELINTNHTIQPGSYHHELRVVWNPVILTYVRSLLPRKQKDVLHAKRERLEAYDIKTVAEYVFDTTTHVVAGKRNTVFGLQALIQARYIVKESYVDAVVYAATPTNITEEENLSPLEEDYNAAWPDPMDHLPPPGTEPTSKSATAYAPDPSRATVFSGFTFVFGSATQHDMLLSAITAGHGKALLMKVVEGETTVDEGLAYMRNAAGGKGFGDFRGQADHGAVILVQWSGSEERRSWTAKFIDAIASALHQRAIDQAEFLHAVLSNDALLLRKGMPSSRIVEGRQISQTSASSVRIPRSVSECLPLTTPPSPKIRTPPDPSDRDPSTIPHIGSQQSQPASRESPEAPTASREALQKNVRVRTAAVSRFKTFDDGFDLESVPTYAPDRDQASPASESYSVGAESAGQSQHESIKTGPGNARKPSRNTPDPEEEAVDELLPAATAMKRRKLEFENARRKIGVDGRRTDVLVEPLPMVQPRKVRKALDVREAVRKDRDAKEAAARREREELQDRIEDVEPKKPTNLAVVEEMKVPIRVGRRTRADGEACDRWNENWNGRKNFKKFRRKGDERRRVHVQNVIVPLVEVRKNTYGIGEQYWDHSEKSKGKKKDRNSGRSSGTVQTQSQAPPGFQTESAEHSPSSTIRLQQEAASIVGEIDVDRPRQTRLSDKTQSQKRKSSSSNLTGGIVTKKQKTLRTAPESDSDSDDLKFRFGRRS